VEEEAEERRREQVGGCRERHKVTTVLGMVIQGVYS
jgi:hypothetical protein